MVIRWITRYRITRSPDYQVIKSGRPPAIWRVILPGLPLNLYTAYRLYTTYCIELLFDIGEVASPLGLKLLPPPPGE